MSTIAAGKGSSFDLWNWGIKTRNGSHRQLLKIEENCVKTFWVALGRTNCKWPGRASGLTERKLVRRKKNPKIRPELTLIAFLEPLRPGLLQWVLVTIGDSMVIRHSDTFLRIFTSIYSLSSQALILTNRRKAFHHRGLVSEQNWKQKRRGEKDWSSHADLIHNLQRNIYADQKWSR